VICRLVPAFGGASLNQRFVAISVRFATTLIRAKMTAGAQSKSRYGPASAPPASERRGSRGKTANPDPIASGVGASNNAIVDAAPSTGRKP
jgi:hypothetical protein